MGSTTGPGPGRRAGRPAGRRVGRRAGRRVGRHRRSRISWPPADRAGAFDPPAARDEGRAITDVLRPSPDGERDPRSLRPDIQGLRALAVASVLVYHLWPTHLTGGFAGVDVFFVISGFLIGGHLLAEVHATGRIRLGRFWARRAKRLLPASLLVLLVTGVATWVVAPLSVRRGFLEEVVGSVLYVQNWVLAGKSVDYLALDDAVSPVRHYWSLSVEEQLYVALPLTLVAVVLLARATGRSRERLLVGVLVALTALSLAWSVLSTRTDPQVAYFSTATRAWEFLAGALLACLVAAAGGPLGRRARTVLGTAGALAVVVAVLVLDDGSPFPGSLALLPVLGTVLILLAGDTGPVAWLSRLRPVTWLGDVSYAVYLWHWPMIVLLPYVTDTALTTTHKVAILAATLALSHVSTFYLEHPLRTSPRLLGAPRRGRTVAVWALAASTVVAATASYGALTAEQQQRDLLVEGQALLEGDDVRCLGAAVLAPVTGDCPDPASYGDLLVPAPSAVVLDTYNRTECWATFGVSELHLCGFGSAEPDAPRVLAIGDSHNNTFLLAYEQMAATLGWRMDVAGRAGCSWGTRPQGGRSETIAAECGRWKEAVADHLATSAPYDLIITTADSDGFLAVPEDGESAEEATVAGLSEAWASQVARGTAVVALLDHPHARDDVVSCVEEHGLDAATACDRSRRDAIPRFDAAREAVEQTPGTSGLSLRGLMCEPRRCRPVVGHVVVYRNPDHLTASFVRTMAPFLAKRIPLAQARAEASATPVG